jgi:hypothetical protein
MSTAFVLGNGRSRLSINLESLRTYGKIYGCNGLYREFIPDVLVATDRPIAQAIEESGYPLTNKFYTRRPSLELGSLALKRPYQGYSSGPNAVALACLDGTKTVYMIGFDCGSPTPYLNNVYANTEFYKTSQDKATYAGNWVKQITQICRDFPLIPFVRVMGKESVHIPEFATISNLSTLQISDFQNLLNSKEGRL